MFHVSILQSEDSDDLYVGFTSNLKKRLHAHNQGENTSTRSHRWTLVYYESFLSEQDARRRERMLKQYGQSLGMLKKRISGSLKGSKSAG
ncbi:hypothetical protein AUJ46_06440 [Candidatus Peregrinibacteria bacterium CG1_02_54_53]|nr:MAG: hypothetical protein AUJ46_06440 [Candidatus Peregrinibacteria bacterium CG1_02_54_53]